MQRKKILLIVGSSIVLLFSILWLLKIVEEPMVAIVSAIITILGYIISEKNQSKETTFHESKPNEKITQIHNGKGDIVGRDKIVNKK